MVGSDQKRKRAKKKAHKSTAPKAPTSISKRVCMVAPMVAERSGSAL
jgi:hypothetical protein